MSVGIAIFIFPRTSFLLEKSIYILLEGTPHSAHEEIKNSILKERGITGVFDIRI